MARSDTTTSSTPFSPFSSYSGVSDATSDDQPDLGAFTNVFRALNDFHQEPTGGIPIPIGQLNQTPSSVALLSPASIDTRDNVYFASPWNNHNSAPEFLPQSWQEDSLVHSSNGTVHERSESEELTDRTSDTEGEDFRPDVVDFQRFEVEDAVEILRQDGRQPSLGDFDQALEFLATERARLLITREATGIKGDTSHSSTSESAWKHAINSVRRKRRRKKPTKPLDQLLQHGNEALAAALAKVDLSSTDGSSSSVVGVGSAFPASKSTNTIMPHNGGRHRGFSVSDSKLKLVHSISTPSLRITTTNALDPRILKLRALAHKLRLLFPEDAARLASILSNDTPNSENFVDPRGPSPKAKDCLSHIFIDHSNILIGFLTYLKKHPSLVVGKSKRLSHAALALILERGRSVTRRVLVTSSPLYQPMETAEQLGYEVRIYARVPDTGDGMDRQTPSSVSGNEVARSSSQRRSRNGSLSSPVKGYNKHHRTASASVTSESDINGKTDASSRSNDTNNTSGIVRSSSNLAISTSTPPRVKYREQGVDELLQLKLHQAIADVDVPPPGSTIVLATGDGNVGQFNEEGFVGCVRTALKKGWKVELYAWEGGLSKSWRREFGEGVYRDKFKIVGLAKFGMDLLEV